MKRSKSKTKQTLVEQYLSVVENAIDEEGVYPQWGIVKNTEGLISVEALAIDAPEIYQWFWRQVCENQAAEIVFGLDRKTLPGQGTEFADCITICHWEYVQRKWATSYKVGVLNYQNEPRIVRGIDWNNSFWQEQFSAELAIMLAKSGIKFCLRNESGGAA